MGVIYKYGIKFHSDFKLLFKGYSMITLFGNVYTNKSYDKLYKWLNTDSGLRVARHERIHIIQAESFKTKYLGFYAYYIGYWIKNLFKYKFNWHKAYREIPFEKEAFTNQFRCDFEKTNWKFYR